MKNIITTLRTFFTRQRIVEQITRERFSPKNRELLKILTVVFLLIMMMGSVLLFYLNTAKTPQVSESPSIQSRVYQPTKIIITNQKQSFWLLNMNQEARTMITNNLKSARFTVNKQEKKSQSQIVKLLNQPVSLQLQFGGSLPSQQFDQLYQQKLTQQKSFDYDTIVLNLKNNRGYFINQITLTVVEVTVTDLSQQALYNLLAANATNVLVKQALMDQQVHSETLNGVVLPQLQYTYIQQDVTNYVNGLLGHGNQVVSQENNHYLNTFTHEKITLDDANQQVSYSYALTGKNLYDNALLNLQFTQNNQDNLIYSEKNDDQLVFNLFIFGLPIWYPNQIPKVIFEQKQQLRAQYSLYDLDLALPNGDSIQLPKESVVKDYLTKNHTSYQDVQIGYVWQFDNSNDSVVLLKPAWLVKMNHHWQQVGDIN